MKHNSSEPLDEYFISEERMYQSLVAAYDPLKWFDYFYQYDSLNFVYDIMADDIYCGGSNEGDQPTLVRHTSIQSLLPSSAILFGLLPIRVSTVRALSWSM